jgi:hypothetical protein
MTRGSWTITVVALVLALTSCESITSPTETTVSPSFGMAPTTEVAFQAQLERGAPVSVACQAGVCEIETRGSGAVNIMGPITYSAHIVQDFTTTPCNVVAAQVTLTGEPGSITLADVTGEVCPNPHAPDFGFISSEWEIVDGTGAFESVTGSGISRGPIGGQGPVVHLSGTVSY